MSVVRQLWVDSETGNKILTLWSQPGRWSTLSEEHDSRVMKLNGDDTLDGKSYVVKFRKHAGTTGPFCYVCIEREYKVGLLANKLNSKNLVRTCGFIEYDNETAAIVTEFVKGKPMFNLNNDPAMLPAEKTALVANVLILIKKLYDEASFTHYDLHTGNIMYVPLGKTVSEISTIGSQRVKVTYSFYPVIIDLGRSYIDGIGPSWVELGLFSLNSTPGLPDPYIDICFFLSNLPLIGLMKEDNPAIQEFLRVGMLERKMTHALIMEERPDGPVVDMVEDGEKILMNWYPHAWTSQIMPGGKVWATSISNGITVRETLNDFFRYLIYETLLTGKTMQDIDYHATEEIKDSMTADEKLLERGMACEYFFEPSADITDTWVKRLGESMVHSKSLLPKPKYSESELILMAIGIPIV